MTSPIWIKFRKLVQNDMSTVVIWLKSKLKVEFQYGGHWGEFSDMSSQFTCHIPGCCHLANLMTCHPRATCHIAGWQNSICHIENHFSLYFIFCFPNAVWASASSGFRIVFDTLVFFYAFSNFHEVSLYLSFMFLLVVFLSSVWNLSSIQLSEDITVVTLWGGRCVCRWQVMGAQHW